MENANGDSCPILTVSPQDWMMSVAQIRRECERDRAWGYEPIKY